jgi:O-antigen/teichoic acid export membrane protein
MAVKVGSTALTKVAVMGVSGVIGIFNSRLIIQHFGTDAYAQYGLLATLPALLPFADLGIAAVVINAVAGSASPKTDDFVRRTIVTAFRVLLISGAIIIAIGIVISVFGWWPVLLGKGLLPDGGSLAAFLCLSTFGLVLPLTVGARVLVGLGKNSTQVALQSVVAPFMLLTIATLVALSAPAGSFLAVLSYVGNALASLLCLIVAARLLRPQIGSALKEIPHPRRYPGVAVIGVAWPMLVQMIALPIAMGTDRLLLSHLTRGTELAQYNLAAQLFSIVLQTIAAAGLTLWPIYARARAERRIESPLRPTLWFMIGGLALGASLAALAPWLIAFISSGKLVLDPWLIWGFVAFVSLQAAKYPAGMYMTDRRGLTFQVWPLLASIPLNLGLSWWLIGVIGAGGPIIGSVISVALCQVIPNLWYVNRDLRARRGLRRAREVNDDESTHQAPM